MSDIEMKPFIVIFTKWNVVTANQGFHVIHCNIDYIMLGHVKIIKLEIDCWKCKSSQVHNDAQMMSHSGFSNAIYFHNSLNVEKSKQLSAVEHLWWKVADHVQNENGRSASKWKWPIRFKMKLADLVQRKNGRSGSKSKWPAWFKIKMTDLVQNEICRYGSKWPIWP